MKNTQRLGIHTLLLITLIIVLMNVVACDDRQSHKSKRPRRIIKRKRNVESVEGPIGLKLSYIQHDKQYPPGDLQQALEDSSNPSIINEVYTLVRVKDGDTIVVSNSSGDITVRLLGVDTPEKNDDRQIVRYFAEQATLFVESLIKDKSIRLGVDPINTKSNHLDRYGRLLAYVYSVEDSINVNAEIIRQGYGFSYVKYPCMYTDYFSALEREARNNRLGLWKD